MPETKTLDTITTQTYEGSTLVVKTSFDDSLPILRGFISPVDQEVDGVLFKMGDLGITIDDGLYPDEVNASLDANGNLIIEGNLAASFSLSANGELIYTY